MSKPQNQPHRFWMLPMDLVMQKFDVHQDELIRKAKAAILAKAGQPRPQQTGLERVAQVRRQMGLE